MKYSILFHTTLLSLAALTVGPLSSCTDYDDDIAVLAARQDSLAVRQDSLEARLNHLSLSDLIQSVVYVPDYSDGRIALVDGLTTTITYNVRPASVAQSLADNVGCLAFVGKEVLTRADTAMLTIVSARATADGDLRLAVVHTGFVGGRDYAVALDIADGASQYRTAYTPVFLTVAVESIAIAAPSLASGTTVNAGRAVQLEAILTPSYATDRRVAWRSSDPTVATVSSSGLLVAVADGRATVTATTPNGKVATLAFTIADGDILISGSDLSQTAAE